ncbi:MAG: rod shape-determining protein MreC [Gemmatimonadota bacterium]
MPPYTTEAGDTGGRKQWGLAFLAIGMAFVLLYLPPGAQQSIATGLRGSILYPFILTQEALARGSTARATVLGMQEEVEALATRLTTLSTLEEENRRLRGLLGLQEREVPAFLGAQVLRPSTRGSESLFLVDVGTLNGIRPHAPVITPEGLAGVVREVGPRISVAMDWTHPDFRASAMTEDGEAYGMVEPRRGEFREVDRLLLNGIAYHEVLAPGTLILTSGRGGVYPRGIVLGTVDEQAEEEAGWRRSYWLRPAVSPGAITHVLVGLGDRATGEMEP